MTKSQEKILHYAMELKKMNPTKSLKDYIDEIVVSMKGIK